MKKIRTPQEGAGAALSAGSTTTSNRTLQTPPEGVLSGFSATAEQFIAASQSAATKRAYASDLKHFFANGGAIPASPVVLAEYLARCAEKLSAATLERRLTAIHKAHLEKSLESPARSETVKRVMQGIRRTLGTKQRQVQPMVKDDLLAALVMIDRQKMPIKAARDRALLLVGFASAMRRSELVAVRVEHLTYLTNGVEIFLPSSKTDQEGQGREVAIPRIRGRFCPCRCLSEWLSAAGIQEGAVFRSINRFDQASSQRLSGQSVALIIKRHVQRIGLDPENFSGHSLRAGFVTTAAQRGVASSTIRNQTGHKSDVTLVKYIRRTTQRAIPSLL